MANAALTRKPTKDRLPNEHDVQSANQLRAILAAQMAENDTVRLTVSSQSAGKADIELGPVLNKLILELLSAVGSGNTVITMPLSKKMTTQEAADVLNVSRPHLIKMLNEEKIPFQMIGRHRRIEARDVFAFQRDRDRDRLDTLTELFQADSEYL